MPWWGSKNANRSDRLGQWIAGLLPPAKTYVEPFAGMLGVLLIRAPSRVEIVNDVDGRIVNWWTVVRERPGDLCEALTFTPVARAEWEHCKQAQWDTTLDDVERARCFTVVCENSVASSFRRTWRAAVRRDLKTQEAMCARVFALHSRIRHVVIEQQDALEVLDRFSVTPESSSTVIYCDPPYKTTHHGKYEELPDWEAMGDLLLNAEAKVAVSGDVDDWPELTEAGWRRHTRQRIVDQPNVEVTLRTEALWCNFASDVQGSLL